jgi:hypothetical protein
MAFIKPVLIEYNLYSPKVVQAAISSVKDWVSNKSCILRKRFITLGMLVLIELGSNLGEEYRRDHPDENYEAPNTYPDYETLRASVSRENLFDWLNILDSRVDLEQCFENSRLEKAIFHVYVCGYRYHSFISRLITF